MEVQLLKSTGLWRRQWINFLHLKFQWVLGSLVAYAVVLIMHFKCTLILLLAIWPAKMIWSHLCQSSHDMQRKRESKLLSRKSFWTITKSLKREDQLTSPSYPRQFCVCNLILSIMHLVISASWKIAFQNDGRRGHIVTSLSRGRLMISQEVLTKEMLLMAAEKISMLPLTEFVNIQGPRLSSANSGSHSLKICTSQKFLNRDWKH
uniref:Uncharacterized protein n=1 Tax=Opuntia streptacantha TaxID=393608 RepID=A0A7C9CIN2_OPUST